MGADELTRVLRHIQHIAANRSCEEWTDAQALNRFIATREEAAFRVLVHRHGPLVWGVCRRVLKHVPDAEDAFQATFLVLAQRARSIRKPQSLGSWLYGVAHHLALEARHRVVRRAEREKQVPNMPQPELPAETVWAQLEPVLDEELQRLPEDCRRPLVLCYLQRKSHREAAEELGWPLGSMSKRLARARELLRQRLTRRGVTLSGGILATVLTSLAATAAPAGLVNTTVKAGVLLAVGMPVTGLASAHALILLQRGSRSMFLTKLKIVTVLLLLLGGLGLVSFGHAPLGKPADAQAETHSPEPTQSKPNPPSAANQGKRPRTRPEAAEMLTVTGRVEDQAQKPVSDSLVVVMSWPAGGTTPRSPDMLGQTTTDGRGQYRIQVKKPAAAHQVAMLAGALGHGLGWHYWPGKGGAVIRLAPEQVLRIRLIDFQGQPAAGIKVHVCRVGKPPPDLSVLDHHELVKMLDTVDGATESLGMFGINYAALSYDYGPAKGDRGNVAHFPALRFLHPPKRLPNWPGPATTDAGGRLSLRGLPRGVPIGLQVRDSGFALQTLAIKPGPEAAPREITRVLLPPRVIEGTVVDAATGKPLAGALVRVPTPARGSFDSGAPPEPSIGEMDWKGRWGINGYRVRDVPSEPSLALIEYLRKDKFSGKSMTVRGEAPARDELPGIATRTDGSGRYRLSLFVAGSYTVGASGPPGGPYLSSTQTVAWAKQAATRRALNLSLSPGVWVKGLVTETPSGKPVAGARVDFWSPGLQLPAGVPSPSPVITGRDGRFQALLLPGSWQLLVNCAGRVFAHQKIAAARVLGRRVTRVAIPDGYAAIVTVRPGGKEQFFYPDGLLTLDLKPLNGPQQVTVRLQAATVRGRLLGPDGKPVARALMFYRQPMPRYQGADATVDKHQVAWKLGCPVRGEPPLAPVEAKDGNFELPLCDGKATYHLYFIDARHHWSAVAEVSGKDRAPTAKMGACGSAKVRLVDVKGKPLAGYRPLLWMLLPPGPHPLVRHSPWESLGPDGSFIPPIASFHTPTPGTNPPALGKVWWANVDPENYGKGFQTDAKGNITLPALIAGATYRIFDPAGRAKDFTVPSGKTLDLGDVVIHQVAGVR